MSVRLKNAESPGTGIRRVCRRHVERALARLAGGNRSIAVHDARKEIKKLRAVFRLAHGSLGRGDYQAIAKAMRLAAKPLAAARDARVTLKALDMVAGQNNAARQFPAAHAALARNSQREEHRFKELDSASVTRYILQTLRRRLSKLRLKTDWETLLPCLKKSYRRSRAAAELAGLAPSPLHFHNWRKQAKQLWYQLDFIGSKWPCPPRAMVEGLEQLGDLLGDDHDLVLLQQFIAGNCEATGETARLNQAIDRRRRQLAAKFQRLGARLFAQTPKTICSQIKRDWKKRRGQK